jgi:hypothetical protein
MQMTDDEIMKLRPLVAELVRAEVDCRLDVVLVALRRELVDVVEQSQ